MQVDVSGSWIYVYSGRDVVDTSAPQEKDPFACVRCISTHAITELLFDDKEMTIRIGVGSSYVYIDFGNRSNARVNAYFNMKPRILEAMERWGLDRGYAENLDRRSDLAAAQRTRADDETEFVD